MIDLAHIPLTAVDSINQIHLEEVNLINRLIQILCACDTNEQSVSELLDALIEHMRLHFESENKLMLENRYGMYRLHKVEHDKVLNEIRFIDMDWRTRHNRESLLIYLTEDLPAWLNQHIKAMDSVLADALK